MCMIATIINVEEILVTRKDPYYPYCETMRKLKFEVRQINESKKADEEKIKHGQKM